jgi:lipoate-protein ligase B
MNSKWLGQIDYISSLSLHEAEHEMLNGLEHTPTITLGFRGLSDVDVKSSKDSIVEQGFQVFTSERGGHATLHSPGQLVIYPIVDIRARGIRVRDYVAILEEATINALREFDVEVFRKHSEPGLYTAQGKIAFFGIRVKNGRTSHGLSINISNDLNYFNMIRSCGRESEVFDKLENYKKNIELEQVFLVWKNHFNKILMTKPMPALTKSV